MGVVTWISRIERVLRVSLNFDATDKHAMDTNSTVQCCHSWKFNTREVWRNEDIEGLGVHLICLKPLNNINPNTLTKLYYFLALISLLLWKTNNLCDKWHDKVMLLKHIRNLTLIGALYAYRTLCNARLTNMRMELCPIWEDSRPLGKNSSRHHSIARKA